MASNNKYLGAPLLGLPKFLYQNNLSKVHSDWLMHVLTLATVLTLPLSRQQDNNLSFVLPQMLEKELPDFEIK